jgi:hypothetical protein
MTEHVTRRIDWWLLKLFVAILAVMALMMWVAPR